MWEELVGKVVHRDQLIICKQRVSENALILTIKKQTLTCEVIDGGKKFGEIARRSA